MNLQIESWAQIEEFPDYSVSTLGHVRNDVTGRMMALTRNQQNILHVGLTVGREQHRRSVVRLVALAFLEPSGNENFDTPIHLDGDHSNCSVDNLMWRPRWFAIKYHMQFKPGGAQPTLVPIVDINTGEKFANSMEACVEYGLLNEEVVLSLINGSFTWPTYQYFAFLAE